VKVYSPKDAYDAWQAGHVTIIDVREQYEYDTTHVAGMPLIPMSELMDRMDELPTDKPLVIFCRSGQRSGQVTDYLDGTGDYDEVANLTGGILAWAADGLPFEGAPPQ
jgi:rhodanese-related sulfurtransferase